MLAAGVRRRGEELGAVRRAEVVWGVAAGLVGERHVAAAFLDVDGVRAEVDRLRAAFATDGVEVLHAFAVKACALVPVLRLVADAGMGCEAASAGELALALAAGVPAG